ncbi:hypothetical protein ACFYO1_21825 [Nocardia sp. NPDC006044]|uniref:hypothetical protein n=1 Tax=Nocardia sp. NPDC006044 TaxID=3364306 RepID=UPI00368D57EF
MNLRSLLPRRHADRVPLLPADDSDSGPPGRGQSAENLERLLTTDELDLIRQHML